MSAPVLPVVYVAGPYRAPTSWQVLGNVRRAQDVALDIWKAGAVCICPHSNTGLFDGECPDSVWLEGDKELLRRSDAIYLMHGWENSAGAKAERLLADELGLPAFCYLVDLRNWIDDWKRVGSARAS